VFHEEIIVHGTAIMLALRFGTRVAVQLDALFFVDILRY